MWNTHYLLYCVLNMLEYKTLFNKILGSRYSSALGVLFVVYVFIISVLLLPEKLILSFSFALNRKAIHRYTIRVTLKK